MVDKVTPKARADKILSDILKGKDLYDNTKERLRAQVPISGKPVDYWENIFKVKIPDINDMSPALVHTYTMQVMQLLQDATFFHAEAERSNHYLKGGAEGAYHQAYWQLVEEFKSEGKKIPAAATLESLARVETIDTENALINSETEVSYWKRVLDHLDRCRKLLETASFSINNELRSSHQANFVEQVAHKGENQ